MSIKYDEKKEERMKLIEAMKNVKSTLRKMEDLRKKITKYCSDLDYMAPIYGNVDEQKKKIAEWLQSHHDLALQLTTLKANIQKTNLATPVTIKVGNNDITRPIAEWVIRRREIVDLEILAVSALQETNMDTPAYRLVSRNNDQMKDAKIRLYFVAEERDYVLEILRSEKEMIDKALEIVNVNTELIDI